MTADVIPWEALETLPPEVQATLAEMERISVADDSLTASIQIMASILAAETEEDIFAKANAETISGEEYIGTPFQVRTQDVRWRRSADQYREQGAFPFYALVTTREEHGVPITLNLGGVSVVPTLFSLWKRGILDKYENGMWLVLGEEKTNSGFDIQKLRKANGPKKTGT